MTRALWIATISASLMWAAPALAQAQAGGYSSTRFAQPLEPEPQPERQSLFRQGRGWFLSGDLGVGSISYGWDNGLDDGGAAFFFDARLGGMLSRRLALSAEFWSDGHGLDDGTAYTQNVIALAVAYWVLPRLWVSFGLGSGTLKHHVGGSSAQELEGTVIMAGTGYEVWSRPRYSVDLIMRMTSGSYDDIDATLRRNGFVVAAGLSWY